MAHVMVVAARLAAAAVSPPDAKRQQMSVMLTATPGPKKRKKKKKGSKKKKGKAKSKASGAGPGGMSLAPVMEAETGAAHAMVDEGVVRAVSEAGGRSAAGAYSAVMAWGE